MKVFIIILAIGVLGYLLGMINTKYQISNLNNQYFKPVVGTKTYDEFREEVTKKFRIGNLLDVAHSFGFNEEKYKDKN